MELDGLQVVEAKAMSRRGKKGAVMRMGRVDSDGLKTLLARGSTMAVETQLIGAFAVKGNASALADQLEADVHLAAMGDTAGFNVADGTTAEAEQHGRPVLVLDLAVRTSGRAIAARCIACLGQPAQRDHRAAELACDGDDMPAEVAQGSATTGATGIEPPGELRIRIGQVVFGVPAAKGHRRADLARAHDVDGVADEGRA